MTPKQLSLFDPAAGRRRRDKALDAFEAKAQAWLAEARAVAHRLAREQGRVTSDDVLAAVGEPPPEVHPAAMGALIRGKEWVRVGVTASKRPRSNASVIGLWALKEGICQSNGDTGR